MDRVKVESDNIVSTDIEIKSNYDLLKIGRALFAHVKNKGMRKRLRERFFFRMRNKYGAFE
jgi:hypothetical protein